MAEEKEPKTYEIDIPETVMVGNKTFFAGKAILSQADKDMLEEHYEQAQAVDETEEKPKGKNKTK